MFTLCNRLNMAYVNSEYETASMPTGTCKREHVIPIHTKANWKDNSCLLKQYSQRPITVTWLQNITTH